MAQEESSGYDNGACVYSPIVRFWAQADFISITNYFLHFNFEFKM